MHAMSEDIEKQQKSDPSKDSQNLKPSNVDPVDLSKNNWNMLIPNISDNPTVDKAVTQNDISDMDASLDISITDMICENSDRQVTEEFKSVKNENNFSIQNSFENINSQADMITFNDKVAETAKEALELALASEVEVHSPWIDVSALAASIIDPSVNVCEQENQNIFAGATFVPTHIQSYIDLHNNGTTENTMETVTNISNESFSSKNTNEDNLKPVETDESQILDTNTFTFEISDDPEINDVFNSKTDPEINKLFEKDHKILESANVFGMESLEINAANSVLFNTDLNLEDTILFDSEPPSDMYVVKTENIFKDMVKRNILKDITADADICKCDECHCDPLGMQCQSTCSDTVLEKEKCHCIDCKCDPLMMKCDAGCGGPQVNKQSSTYLDYHKRHGPSSLEEFGLFPEGSSKDKHKCCSKDKEKNATGCCSKRSDQQAESSNKSACPCSKSTPASEINTNNQEPNTNQNSDISVILRDFLLKLENYNSNCTCLNSTDDIEKRCCVVICLKTLENLRQLVTYGTSINGNSNSHLHKCSGDTIKYNQFPIGCKDVTT